MAANRNDFGCADGAQVHVTHRRPHLPNVTNRAGPTTKSRRGEIISGSASVDPAPLGSPVTVALSAFDHRAMDPPSNGSAGAISFRGGASSDFWSLVEKTPQPRQHQIQRPACSVGCQRQLTVRRSILTWWDRVVGGATRSILGNNNGYELC